MCMLVCSENSSVSRNPISNGGGYCTGCYEGMQCDSQLSVLLRNKTAKLHFHINQRLLRECASKIILQNSSKSWSEPPWEFLMSRYRVGSARCYQNGQIKYMFLGSSSTEFINFNTTFDVSKNQE